MKFTHIQEDEVLVRLQFLRERGDRDFRDHDSSLSPFLPEAFHLERGRLMLLHTTVPHIPSPSFWWRIVGCSSSAILSRGLRRSPSRCARYTIHATSHPARKN